MPLTARDLLLPANESFQQASESLERGTRYGEAYRLDAMSLDAMALDGSLFAVRNATRGTGVTVTANVTEAAASLAPWLLFETSPTAKKYATIHRVWIKFIGIGTTHALLNMSAITSVGAVVTTAGTDYLNLRSTLTTAGYYNLRSDINRASEVMAKIRAGVPVITLGSNPRVVFQDLMRSATIPVAGDEITINFGGANFKGMMGDHAEVASTTVNRYFREAAPVVLGPGTSLSIAGWAASMAGTTSIEFEVVWSER